MTTAERQVRAVRIFIDNHRESARVAKSAQNAITLRAIADALENVLNVAEMHGR